jgi:sterol 24-C-methyltransferase
MDKIVKKFEELPKEAQIASGVGAGLMSLVLVNKMFGTDPVGRTAALFGKFFVQEKKRGINVNEWIDKYNDLHSGDASDERNEDYKTLVNYYYELATTFYEWGWGQSFHFAYQLPGEDFRSAIARHEYYLAGQLQCLQGQRLLDVGCGVGGPMRNIAKFTRCDVTGVTLNEYQVIRGNQLCEAEGVARTARSVQCDFLKLTDKFELNSFDGVYAIEATCHAPKREVVYSQIFKVLKPGRYFACYEWCLTPKYDKNNEFHQLIKKKIEEGDGLPGKVYLLIQKGVTPIIYTKTNLILGLCLCLLLYILPFGNRYGNSA